MKLYYGSNMKVEQPVLLSNQRALDFGKGFYLTSSKEQAIRLSKTKAKRSGTGNATVNVYDINDKELNSLLILKFDDASEDWLDYVSLNRRTINVALKYDVVIAPIIIGGRDVSTLVDGKAIENECELNKIRNNIIKKSVVLIFFSK